MNATPTGSVTATDGGIDLVTTRMLHAPIGDVWASITEPDRAARWYGTWSEEVRVGQPFTLTMTAEDGAPEVEVTVTACEPPRHLSLSQRDSYGTWVLTATLDEDAGTTTLVLTQRFAEPDPAVGEIGPGWEYYLDRLVAAVGGGAMPDFDDYYPSMKPHFEAQLDRR